MNCNFQPMTLNGRIYEGVSKCSRCGRIVNQLPEDMTCEWRPKKIKMRAVPKPIEQMRVAPMTTPPMPVKKRKPCGGCGRKS